MDPRDDPERRASVVKRRLECENTPTALGNTSPSKENQPSVPAAAEPPTESKPVPTGIARFACGLQLEDDDA